jgi:hypothetical protein
MVFNTSSLQHPLRAHQACVDMFQNIKAAEKAALEGEGQDWDTQQCRLLQDEILSVRICGRLAVRRSSVLGSH